MSPSRNELMAPLLAEVLSVEKGSPFVVLRNADGLPQRLTGRDVDVSLKPGTTVTEAAERVLAAAEQHGWQVVVDSRRDHMAGVTLFHADVRETLHFDLFKGITHVSNPLFSVDDLWNETEVVGDVRRLSKRMEVLATTVHRVVFGGTLNKRKYVDQLAHFLEDAEQRRWLEECVSLVLGPDLARELTNPEALEPLTRNGGDRARRARRAFWRNRLRASPTRTLANFTRYGAGQLGSVFHPPGVVGVEGDPFPGLNNEVLTLELASALSAYGFQVKHVRADAAEIKTLNAPRFEDMLRQRWKYWTPLRQVAPSLFLWLQAKRTGVVIVDRLPTLLRALRRSPMRPRWLTGRS